VTKPVGSVTPLSAPTEEWWDIDAEVLSALAGGAKSPEELSATLGMSEHAATSLVAMLAQQGRVRIRLVEFVR
jgi:biotin operon repressor